MKRPSLYNLPSRKGKEVLIPLLMLLMKYFSKFTLRFQFSSESAYTINSGYVLSFFVMFPNGKQLVLIEEKSEVCHSFVVLLTEQMKLTYMIEAAVSS